MDLSELVISVTPPNLVLKNMPVEHRKALFEKIMEIRESVLEHHKRTCRFCGFAEAPALVRQVRADHGDNPVESSLVISPLNGDPTDLSPGNLHVACVFCAAVNSVNTVEVKDAWAVIYLPGVPQYYLSWIARTMFVVSDLRLTKPAMTANAQSSDDIDDAAYRLISETLIAFMGKFDIAQKSAARYKGLGTIDSLATCMVDLAVKDPELYADRAKLLTAFKIIPRACINDDWTHFFRYRSLIQQATTLSGLKSFKDMMRVAHQAYSAVYEQTFPSGDPLKMEEQMGAKRSNAG